MAQIGESLQKVHLQAWSNTLDVRVIKKGVERDLISYSGRILRQANERSFGQDIEKITSEIIHCRIMWAIQKQAVEVDLQIGTTRSLLFREQLPDITRLIRVDLLQLL